TLASNSLYAFGFGWMAVGLAIRAGDIGYHDDGPLQVAYILLRPCAMFEVAMIAEYWVESLPSQILTPDSFAGKLRNASETSSLFVVIGVANGGLVSLLGVMTFFARNWPQQAADIFIVGGVLTAELVIFFVASRITAVINQATSIEIGRPGSPSSRAFYFKAKRNLWIQAAALCGVGCFPMLVIAIKRLTMAGRSTPIILETLQILTGHGGAIMFSSATSFDQASGMKRNSAVNTSGVPWSRRISAAQMGVVSAIASEAAPSAMIARIKSMNPKKKGKAETTELVQAEEQGEISKGSRRSGSIGEDAIEVVPFVQRSSGSFGADCIRHPPHPKAARVIPISVPLTAISVSSDETSTSSMTAGRN
ncbi:unnamed protein product, partial [Ectocarpus sp. 12 AP-2014]